MNLIEELKNEGLVTERVIPKLEVDDGKGPKKKLPPPAKLDKSKGQNIPAEDPGDENDDEVSSGDTEAPDDGEEGDPADAAASFEAHMISSESAFRHAVDMALYAGKKWAEEMGEEDAKSGIVGECMIKLKECQQAYDNLYKNKDKGDDSGKQDQNGQQSGFGDVATAKGQSSELETAIKDVSGGGQQPGQNKEA